jgi:hypothetical protein
MANLINEIFCNVMNSNTATPNCYYSPKKLNAMMLIPKGTMFTATEVQTLQTQLIALTKLDNESLRGYPIHDLMGMEAKDTEIALNTAADGSVSLGTQGKFHWLWEYSLGGWNRYMKLNTFTDNQSAYDVLMFDLTGGVVVGTSPTDSDHVLQGFSMDLIYSPLPKVGNGTDPTKYYFGIAFADSEEFARLAYYVLPKETPLKAIKGLRDLELTKTSMVTTVLKVKVTTDGGAVDMYNNYGTALAALTWTAAKASDGTALTISSVAATAATKTLNFTFSAPPTESFILTSPTITAMNSTVPGFGNATLTVII